MKKINSACLWAVMMASLPILNSCGSKDSGDQPTTLPLLSIATVSAPEGNTGNKSFVFEFTLDAAPAQQVSLSVSTLDSTAKAALDYVTITNRAILFEPGETKKTLSVDVVGDEWKEGEEEFLLRLQNLVGCRVISNFAKGVIQNDDSQIFFDDAGYTTPTTYPGYTLAWADEFNGSSLNLADWNFESGDGCPNVCGWGNNELQWYTPGENLYVQRGKMIIEARNETKGTKNYTSSRITTQGKKTFTFGRIDIRAKLPYGQGIWPALWMLGSNITSVSWPACGEMDIMELLGQEPNKVYSTVHFAQGTSSRNISKSVTKPTSFSDAFHVYSLVWEADKMRFFVDDELISEVTKADISPNNYPFNNPFFFIFNIAVGGNWPGSPNASTRFPQWMFVDYVRVFQ